MHYVIRQHSKFYKKNNSYMMNNKRRRSSSSSNNGVVEGMAGDGVARRS